MLIKFLRRIICLVVCLFVLFCSFFVVVLLKSWPFQHWPCYKADEARTDTLLPSSIPPERHQIKEEYKKGTDRSNEELENSL